MFGLETGLFILLLFALFCACAFEFVNGFHDTANAVATVIYTNSLRPWQAVVWSGIMNFAGVLMGGIAVAMGIVNLLPVELLIDQSVAHSVAMVLALLLSAIFWNLGTWYYGLPASSSHTLIGSILGVGLAFSLLPENAGQAVPINWTKAEEIGISLLVSPLVGFTLAMSLVYLMRWLIKDRRLFEEPPKDQPPPAWIRILLILTCTGVSFSHGSNDGQKGVGLVMLILIGILPTYFALDSRLDLKELSPRVATMRADLGQINTSRLSVADQGRVQNLQNLSADLEKAITGPIIEQPINTEASRDVTRFRVRKDILLFTKNLNELLKSKESALPPGVPAKLQEHQAALKQYTDYAPRWVVLMISLSLGIGTMVGWKRIVLTIGEKIGKQHLTYAQGASAELVAASTIGISSGLGLPVSTTHILSSGIAGTMVASNGLGNLQPKTIRNIAMAWLLTLPVCILLSGGLFLLFRWVL